MLNGVLGPCAAAVGLAGAALALAPACAQAGTLKVAGGVLSYVDTDPSAANVVTISRSTDGSFTVREAGRSSGKTIAITSDGSCSVSRTTGTCPGAGVAGIDVQSGAQADTVQLSAGLATPARLAGGEGNDLLTGGAGDDTLRGEAGADTLGGSAGSDTADYSDRSGAVAVSLDNSPGDGEAGENDNVRADVERVLGGAGDDSITGGDADNVLIGNGGNDTLAGGAGNDLLDGGDGIDTASYAASPAGVHVTLDGNPGDGAPGEADKVETENVIGSPGDDVLIGNAGVNVIQGGAGADRLLGGPGADALDAGAGDDLVEALDGARDTIACGDGLDGVVTDKPDVRSDCESIKYRVLTAGITALHVSHGAVRIPVRCSPATTAGCHGRITIKYGRRALGRRAFSLSPGRRWAAKVTLSRRGLHLAAARGGVSVVMVVRNRDAAGQVVATTQVLRIAR